VIVHNFNFIWASRFPLKADTVLLVDTNAVLTFTVIFERLKVIARRDLKFVKGNNRIE
jgi:hypothetical protein